MEYILLILTSTFIAAAICGAFYLGYKNGKAHRDTEGVKFDKNTAKVLRDYANLYSYDGNER